MEVEVVNDNKLCLSHLSTYAHFLIKHRIQEVEKCLWDFSIEFQLPVIKHLEHLKLKELVHQVVSMQLKAIEHGKVNPYIADCVTHYLMDTMSVSREKITAEDITRYSWIRKKVFLHFLKDYTTDLLIYEQVVQDIDLFSFSFDSAALQAFMSVQNQEMASINRELHEKQEELMEAQELTNMGSFWWDIKNRQVHFTPGVSHIFDLEEEMKWEDFLNHVHEEDRKMLKKMVDDVPVKGPHECEFRYIKKHKEKRIWSRGLVTYEEGKPLSLKGVVMDVTHKYRLIEQLKESEQLNKQAQSITHIGNWIWEIATEKITWSDEMYRIYGLEPQSEIITLDRWLSLIHPNDQETRLAEIRQSLVSRTSTDSIVRIITDAGDEKVLRGRSEVILDKSKKDLKLIGTCQDVTVEYELNNELHAKEKYLQELIRNAPDAVVVVDKESSIQLWNPKMEELFGWNAKEVKGQNLRDLIIPFHNRASYSEELTKYLETGVTNVLNRTMEIKVLNRNKEEFDVSLTISPSVQQGKLFFIAFMRDITRQKAVKNELKRKTIELEQVNTSLAQKNAELERMNAELESFNYVASHDLKEPLRKIQIFAQRISEEEGVKSSCMAYFNKIVTASARMQALIEDLLVFSQAKAPENQFEEVNLNEVLENVLSLLSATIEDKRAKIESEILPTVKAITFQMQQLFLNLLSNALKYSGEQVAPIIRIQVQEVNGFSLHHVKALPDKKYFQISVKDNGIGFESQYAEKIFELFQRLHNKDQYFGTGIGLAICKKIVYNHHGFIVAKGKPREGSEFVFYLPVS